MIKAVQKRKLSIHVLLLTVSQSVQTNSNSDVLQAPTKYILRIEYIKDYLFVTFRQQEW